MMQKVQKEVLRKPSAPAGQSSGAGIRYGEREEHKVALHTESRYKTKRKTKQKKTMVTGEREREVKAFKSQQELKEKKEANNHE